MKNILPMPLESNTPSDKPTSSKPFILQFREPMSGVVIPSTMHSDDSTYMGQTAQPPGNGVPDYSSD